MLTGRVVHQVSQRIANDLISILCCLHIASDRNVFLFGKLINLLISYVFFAKIRLAAEISIEIKGREDLIACPVLNDSVLNRRDQIIHAEIRILLNERHHVCYQAGIVHIPVVEICSVVYVRSAALTKMLNQFGNL